MDPYTGKFHTSTDVVIGENPKEKSDASDG
jgi:hypothetical protein